MTLGLFRAALKPVEAEMCVRFCARLIVEGIGAPALPWSNDHQNVKAADGRQIAIALIERDARHIAGVTTAGPVIAESMLKLVDILVQAHKEPEGEAATQLAAIVAHLVALDDKGQLPRLPPG